MLSAFLTFMPAAALLIIAPGPDSLLVLRNSARGGRRGGVATAAGTVTGLLVWAAAAGLGLAALLRASEIGYLVVRCAGAAYLLFLGSQLIWRSLPRNAGAVDHAGAPAEVPRRGPRAQYLAGAGTNLLNPKVGVFFISFLPAFIPRGVPVGQAALALGGIFVLETTVWLAAIVLLGERFNAIVSRASVRRRLDRLTGLVMVGFGVRLALERR